MMSKRWLLVLLLATTLLLGAVTVRAEEDDGDDGDDDNEDTIDTTSAPDVETESSLPDEDSEKSEFAVTYTLFPKHADLQLPAGSLIPILIGFQNIGDTTFTITQIDGSFRHPLDYTYHIQNFSVVELETTVGPKQLASFNYYIRPHESFEPRQIGLQVTVHYRDSSEEVYLDAAFNKTVDIVDSVEGFDATGSIAYVAVIGAVAAAVLFMRNKGQTEASTPVEKGTTEDGEENEWLANHHAQLRSQGSKKEEAKKSD